jgi:hypothetical protein
MIRLWERSRKPHAADELRSWRAELRQIDIQAAKLEQGARRRPTRLPEQLDPEPAGIKPDHAAAGG